MQVKVEEIGCSGLDIEFSYTLEELPVLAEVQKSGTAYFITPVVCVFSLNKIAQMIEVQGRARVSLRMQCSRCLAETNVDLEVEFKQTYVEELPHIIDDDDGEVELSAEQMGLELFDGEYIDLHDEIQQQIVLAIPARPLCTEKCKGLCSSCGADLNKGECSCNNKKISMHFAALQNFKVEK